MFDIRLKMLSQKKQKKKNERKEKKSLNKRFWGTWSNEEDEEQFKKTILIELQAIALYESIRFIERQGNTEINSYGQNKRYKNIN